jgi:penicillin amidase
MLLAVGLGSGYLWFRSSLPQTSGTVTLAGLHRPVEIVRDTNAVPHIFAESPADAYFALGYVHAQDRLWQMEFTRRLGAGRLAEVLGEPAAKTDRFIRTLGFHRLAEGSVEALSVDVRAALDAYAAGVNAWLETRSGALPPEFVLFRVEPEPWKPADTLLWSRLMALRLGRNWQTELIRASLAERLELEDLPPELLGELWPEASPGSPITLSHAAPDVGPLFDAIQEAPPPTLFSDGASNGWIVHGRLTETGKPILANDPHLSFEAPILWYLARIEAPGLSVTGATIPGVPFTILGHNRQIAWGMTNAFGDTADLFVETVDPQDPDSYLTPDGPRPFVTRKEDFHVGGETIPITVRKTHHGPVISDVLDDAARVGGADHVVALAMPALRPDDRTVEALYAINRARDWDGFLAAAAKFHAPHVNLFFAATDGDIGFISAGRIPVRKAGDGRLPAPGSDGAHDWRGFIPFERLPRTHNPSSGRIVNANNGLVDDSYPYLIAHDWAEPFRAERIVEVLDAKNEHTIADSEALQMDVLSPAARRLLPAMLTVTPADASGRRAVALLSGWNHEMRRNRPEPLIYTAWRRHLAKALAEDELGDLLTDYWNLKDSRRTLFVEAALTRNRHWCDDVATPERETCQSRLALALDRALEELAAKYGSDMEAWRWGSAHRATFSHRVLTKVPGVRWLADLSIESDGGDDTVSRGETRSGLSGRPYAHVNGSGFRAVYDLSNLDNSRFIIATGQSGNFLAAYYSDLSRPWRDGGYIRIAGNPDGIASTAIARLSLRPAAQ